MTIALLTLASGLALAASLAFYLGAPSQRILGKRLALGPCLGAGFGLAALSLILFLQVSGPAASVFIVMTLIMAAWSGLPFLMAVLRPGQRRRK